MADSTPDDDGDDLVRLGKLAIGSAVRSGRSRVGASQRLLAERSAISQPVISRLETGRLNGIRWQTLARIIGVLHAARAFRIAETATSVREPPREP